MSTRIRAHPTPKKVLVAQWSYYVLSQTKTKPKLVIRSGLTQLKSCAEGPKGKTIQLTNPTHLLRANMYAVKRGFLTEHSWCSGHTAPFPKPKPKLSVPLSVVVRAQLKRLRVQGNNRRLVVVTIKNCDQDYSSVVFILIGSRQSMKGRAIIQPKQPSPHDPFCQIVLWRSKETYNKVWSAVS